MLLPTSLLVLLATTTSLTLARPNPNPSPNPDLDPTGAASLAIWNPMAGAIASAVVGSKIRDFSLAVTDNRTLAAVSTTLQAQLECLKTYADFGWDGNACDGRGYYMKGVAWENPADCYGVCHNLTESAILNDRAGAECHAQVGSAQCWMGYHDENLKRSVGGS